MATASIPASSATRKRRPDPTRVVQSYHHEVSQRGRRGAYRRTGDLYNISDETVRRFVHAAEERANTPPLPDELAYMPPPFSDELAALQTKSAAEVATEAHQRDISNAATPQPAPQWTPVECGSITSTSRSDVASVPHFENATRHTVDLSDRPADDSQSPQGPHEPGHARPDVDNPGAEAPELPPESFPNPEPNQPPSRQGDPYDGSRSDGEMEPKRGGIPRSPSGFDQLEERPARETPEERPQPTGIPRSPSGGELPEERPRRPEAIIVRQVVRVPEPRQVGGLVGWLSTNPMLGPVPVWALLLLGFGALLVQLGLLG